MAKVFSKYCVYTIVHPSQLPKRGQRGRKTFCESKAWVTGEQLWRRAREEKLGFPVLLGDATNCSRLKYWGLLRSVEIKGQTTRFSVNQVRELRESHKPQELVLRSTGKHIAPNFIRPYAICRTPAFLPGQRRRTRRRSTEVRASLENRYPGITESILRFERAELPACPRCGSQDTANVQVGLIGRTIDIAAATTKFKLIPNGPKPGAYFCNACGEFFG
jgi:hypothetical protein